MVHHILLDGRQEAEHYLSSFKGKLAECRAQDADPGDVRRYSRSSWRANYLERKSLTNSEGDVLPGWIVTFSVLREDAP